MKAYKNLVAAIMLQAAKDYVNGTEKEQKADSQRFTLKVYAFTL